MQETPRALSDLDAAALHSAIQYVPALDRELRMDTPASQGLATFWFSDAALELGEVELAERFATYERSEYQRLADTVLGGWVTDLLSIVQEAVWSGPQSTRLLHVYRAELWGRMDAMADRALDDVHAAIRTGERAWFRSAYRGMRDAHILSNDVSVRLVQDLLSAIADAQGEDAVLAALEVSYERIWRPRYEAWFRLNPLERLALSAEGMRAHYGGPGRVGDFEVVEHEDHYLMRFDPCGTGQVMRREQQSRDGNPHIPVEILDGTAAGHPWAQGVEGMPYYCTHCPVLLEYLPLRDYGSPLRPVMFAADPWVPCAWVIAKR
jgi:hypothetical protein